MKMLCQDETKKYNNYVSLIKIYKNKISTATQPPKILNCFIKKIYACEMRSWVLRLLATNS